MWCDVALRCTPEREGRSEGLGVWLWLWPSGILMGKWPSMRPALILLPPSPWMPQWTRSRTPARHDFHVWLRESWFLHIHTIHLPVDVMNLIQSLGSGPSEFFRRLVNWFNSSEVGYVKAIFLVQGSTCSVINWQRGTLRPDPSSAAALTNFLYNAKSTADFKQGERGRVAVRGRPRTNMIFVAFSWGRSLLGSKVMKI